MVEISIVLEDIVDYVSEQSQLFVGYQDHFY
jgi:hypothetical protein